MTISLLELISNLGDVYVNDAFPLVHIELMPQFMKFQKFLPSFSELQLDLEVNALNKIIS